MRLFVPGIIMTVADATIISELYVHRDGIKGVGKVAITKEVASQLECAALCLTVLCVCYNLEVRNSTLTCAALSTIREFTEQPYTRSFFSRKGLYQHLGFIRYKEQWVMARDPTLPRLTWDDSVAWCRSLPGSVFLPQTLEDFDWMVEIFRTKYEDGYMFFPLNDKEKEGDFVWVNGSSAKNATQIRWHEGQEGAGNTIEDDCVAIESYHDYTLRVHACDHTHYAMICAGDG
ncbi:uncharacterized protein LOC119591432 [Penaeus monodon]|uniref:uncharacterized protein LOC119591432 n=1 Tax=Penaeus monodon TaxID=6687 RepID=UPI0018A6D7C3|nr:uncharacterized protein LOC119591432 [Penaeus monodon]